MPVEVYARKHCIKTMKKISDVVYFDKWYKRTTGLDLNKTFEITRKRYRAYKLKWEGPDKSEAPLCQCEINCGKQISWNNQTKRWNKYVHGHVAYCKNTIKLYPFEFNDELRKLIRERDSKTCQLCNRTWKIGNRKFHIHHIDYNKENTELDNIITLCTSCHMKTNSKYKRKYYQKKLYKILNVNRKECIKQLLKEKLKEIKELRKKLHTKA